MGLTFQNLRGSSGRVAEPAFGQEHSLRNQMAAAWNLPELQYDRDPVWPRNSLSQLGIGRMRWLRKLNMPTSLVGQLVAWPEQLMAKHFACTTDSLWQACVIDVRVQAARA